MPALKGLVIFMGVLIVMIMTVIAYGLYRKSSDPDFKFFSLGSDKAQPEKNMPTAIPTPPSGNGGNLAFGEIDLNLPEGCHIANVSGDGTRIFLKIGPAGPLCERVVVVDAGKGTVLGTLKASP